MQSEDHREDQEAKERRRLTAGHARTTAQGRPLNRVLSTLVLLVVIGLIPWTIWLGQTLPSHYRARNWNVVWTGFDVILLSVLAYAAWAIWARRQIMAMTALVAGTLLLCDAWFDVGTSFGGGGQGLTLVTAVFGEIPLAIFFYWVAYRVMVLSVAAFHVAIGAKGPPPRLRDAVLFFVVADSPAPEAPPRAESGDSGGVIHLEH